MHLKSLWKRFLSKRGDRGTQQFRPVFTGFPAGVALVLLCGAAVLEIGHNLSAQGQSKAASQEPVARGKYIVEGVARCGQCHTPLDNDGNPDRTRWLQGAPIRWMPAVADSNWPVKAPRIGGAPLPASDEDMIKLLTTGVWTTGEHLRDPMPQFRMERSDAAAVVAYLKSLTPQP